MADAEGAIDGSGATARSRWPRNAGRKWPRPAAPEPPKAPIGPSTRAGRSAPRSTVLQPAAFTGTATGELRCSVAGTSAPSARRHESARCRGRSGRRRPAACQRPSGPATANPAVVQGGDKKRAADGDRTRRPVANPTSKARIARKWVAQIPAPAPHPPEEARPCACCPCTRAHARGPEAT